MKLAFTLFALFAVALPCMAASCTASLAPSADAFVTSYYPGNNYGAAGGLSVSGSTAVNGQGTQMGTLDTFIGFNLAATVSSFDSQFGNHAWTLTAATLRLTEQAAPNNPIFNRGVGRFETRWIASDTWTEGTGNPNNPSATGITFQQKSAFLNSSTDASLGVFSNKGVNDDITFALALPHAFIDDVRSGGQVSLFFTAVDSSVGFTFNARELTAPRLPPSLILTAAHIDGDVNLDCKVNILDLIAVRNHLNEDVATGGNSRFDLNTDGKVNILDLIYVRSRLNTSCWQ